MQHNKVSQQQNNPELSPTPTFKPSPLLHPNQSSRKLISGKGSTSTLMSRLEQDRLTSKCPSQVMLEMLQGVAESDPVRPAHSKESEEQLSSLLTNAYKRTSFIESMEEQLPRLPASIANHYKLLLILLKKVADHSVTVSHPHNDSLRVEFDHDLLDRQQQQIQSLEDEKQRRKGEVRGIMRDYEQVITNLNEVTEKMLSPNRLSKQSKASMKSWQ